MKMEEQSEKNCEICYRRSPNVNNRDCYWNWEECQGEHFRKYDPEKCTRCESENEKPDPWGKIPCGTCGWGGEWTNYIPKQNWVSISKVCPKCHKDTVLSNGKIWKCGCGFAYRLNFSGDYLLRSESFIESSKSCWYEMEEEDISDEIYFLQGHVRTARLDKYHFQHLIGDLKDIIRMLEFRLKSITDPRLQRFCPDCHSILIEDKNDYFYCNKVGCELSLRPQRGVEDQWKFSWVINPSRYPIVEYGRYDVWSKIINSQIYKNISKILNWRE
jgi:hypothetical protein